MYFLESFAEWGEFALDIVVITKYQQCFCSVNLLPPSIEIPSFQDLSRWEDGQEEQGEGRNNVR